MHTPAKPLRPQTGTLLRRLMKGQGSAALDNVLAHAARHRLQICYTRIDRDAGNRPSFRTTGFRLDPEAYFYPASTVKLPLALLALEKLRVLNFPGLTMDTPMFTGDAFNRECGSRLQGASIAQCIREILLVSDNEAANRLYEFVGPSAINTSLHGKGYPGTLILHKLDVGRPAPKKPRTGPVRFVKDGREVFGQPGMTDPGHYPVRKDFVGKFHKVNKKQVRGPMDFSQKNRAPLEELMRMLRCVLFPEAMPEQERFRLSGADYTFLYRLLSAFPTESKQPRFDPLRYPPAYAKFLLFGGEAGIAIPPGLRIFNKAGWAYGFLTDIAYVADFKHRVEFLLGATLQVNEDGVLLEDHYQYDTLGKPFLRDLGQAVYRYELERSRKYLPDLARYSLPYGV